MFIYTVKKKCFSHCLTLNQTKHFKLLVAYLIYARFFVFLLFIVYIYILSIG